MTDPAREADLFSERVAVVPLPSEVVLRLRGADAVPWLNGQVTQDVRALRPDASVYALLLDARGKIMTDLRVFAVRPSSEEASTRPAGAETEASPEVALLVPEAGVAAMLAHADKYIIMEEVEVVRDDAVRVVHVAGPRAGAALARTGLEVRALACDRVGWPGFDVVVSAADFGAATAALVDAAQAEGGDAVSDEGVTLARLRRGVPAFGVDFGARTYPQEAGLKERAVSFQKGCYLGQEVVVTLEHRGQLVRKLVRLTLPRAVAAGTRLTTADGAEVGETTSSAEDARAGHAWAFGYVKRAAAVAGESLRAGTLEARIDRVLGG
jgi:folate-binding protein YgfZ